MDFVSFSFKRRGTANDEVWQVENVSTAVGRGTYVYAEETHSYIYEKRSEEEREDMCEEVVIHAMLPPHTVQRYDGGTVLPKTAHTVMPHVSKDGYAAVGCKEVENVQRNFIHKRVTCN